MDTEDGLTLGRWNYRRGLTTSLLYFSKKQEGGRGKNPKLQRWLHEEVQVTSVGRLLWFFASRLRSSLPLEQKSEEGWTMRWMEALCSLAPGLQRSAGRQRIVLHDGYMTTIMITTHELSTTLASVRLP